MAKKVYLIGSFITLIVTATLMTILLTDQFKIDVTKTKTTFYVNESNNWVVSGVEYISLYNKSTKLTSPVCSLSNYNSEGFTRITRSCLYKNLTRIVDVYEFNGNLKDKESFPISHQISVYGGKGFTIYYDIKNAVLISSSEKETIFQKNMKVEYDLGYKLKKTTPNFQLRYDVDSDIKTYNIRFFDPIMQPGNINITILQNGVEAYRNYELGTSANITILTNKTTSDKVCLSIAQPGGVNYSCTDAMNLSVLYSQSFITFNQLANGNFTQNVSNNQLVNMTSYNYEPVVVSLQLFGLNISPNIYPTNIKVDLKNDNYIDSYYLGYLNGSTLYQTNFSDGTYIENITYLTAGTNIRYMNYSCNNHHSMNITNLSFKLWGYSSDPNQFTFTEKFNNATYMNNSVTASVPYVFWDDVSTPDIYNHFYSSGSASYSYVQGSQVSQDQSGCTPTGGTCASKKYCGQSSSFGTQSLNLGQYNQVKISFSQSASAGECSCGNCGYFSGGAGIGSGIYDQGTGSKTTYETSNTNGIITITKENGFLNWYTNGVYKGQQVYDSNKDYEVFWDLSATTAMSSSGGYPCYCGAGASVAITAINYSGLTSAYSGNLNWNTITAGTYISNVLYTAPKNISRAILTTVKRNPSGGSEQLWMSLDNGTTWESATSGNPKVFTAKNNTIRVKISVTATSATAPLIISSYRLDIGTGTLSNITIDVGNDNIDDYIVSGVLNESNSPQNFSTAFVANNYVVNACGNEDNKQVSLPISISSDSAGVLGISNILSKQIIGPTIFNLSEFTQLRNVSLNLSFENSGMITLSDIQESYYGDKSVNITASVGATSNSALVNWKYSPFSIGFGNPDVEYLEFFPKSRRENNTQPYGQNSTTPIWFINSSNVKHTEGLDLYVKLNESVDTCVKNITFSGRNFSTSGLVAYYSFNDNSSRDYSGNNLNGADTTMKYLPGKISLGANFSAVPGTKITLGNSDLLKITKNQTIVMWIYPNDTSVRRNPFAKAYGGEGTITQETNGYLNYFYGTTGADSGSDGVSYQSVGTGGPIPSNRWTHVALVRDLTNMKIRWYVNGTQTQEINAIFTAATASALNAYIGAGYVSEYSGMIDEVMIFNRSLSADEINSIYTSGSYYNPINLSLTTLPRTIFEKVQPYSNSPNLFAYVSLDCSSYQKAFIIPNFCFFTLCSNCVKTVDWNSTCTVYE